MIEMQSQACLDWPSLDGQPHRPTMFFHQLLRSERYKERGRGLADAIVLPAVSITMPFHDWTPSICEINNVALSRFVSALACWCQGRAHLAHLSVDTKPVDWNLSPPIRSGTNCNEDWKKGPKDRRYRMDWFLFKLCSDMLDQWSAK